MKPKDYLVIALVPLALLLIPLTGNLTVEGWNWSPGDFLLAYVVFALTTFAYRLLATRAWANLAYRLGAALGVLAGFLMFWITIAVGIIGEDNPANLLYPLAILGGAIGLGVAQFKARGVAKVAFGMAGAVFLIPIAAVAFWPADFSPGVTKVFILNGVFVLLFTASGLCFRHAARQGEGKPA
jgi:hypothetical protein